MPWLQVNPEGGLAGWGAPPALHGGDVSSLANAIALMRQHQTENTVKSIADAIKTYSGHKEDDAYLQALQNAGLIQSGEGMSAEGGTNLAKLIETQKLRALQEQLYGAHSSEYNAMAERYKAMAAMAGVPKELTAYQQLQEDRRNQNAAANDQNINDLSSSMATIKALEAKHPEWVKAGPTKPPAGGMFGTGPTPPDVWNQWQADAQTYRDAKDKAMKAYLHSSHSNLSTPPDDSADDGGDVNNSMPLPTGGGGTPQAPPAQQQQAPAPQPQASPPPQASSTPPPSNLAPDYGRQAGLNIGGYVAGKRYGGMMYLGGDPKDKSNWQQ